MIRADEGLAFLLQYENVAWYTGGAVRILDRRIFPIRTEYVTCKTHQEVAAAIADMVTQSGGPYLAAAMGMALAAKECAGQPGAAQLAYLRAAAHTLAHARPTTAAAMREVTGRALARAEAALAAGHKADEAVFAGAVEDINNKYLRIEKTGEALAGLFPAGGTVMTQCFAETIVGMMLRACQKSGKQVQVICPETRPYYQGARLTASCVRQMGFPVTVITDNMPAWVMHQKKVDVFTSAADVITMDGHVVNKVGTLQIALAARHFGVPYYVTGTPSMAHPGIGTVEMEERDPGQVLQSLGVKTVLEGVRGYYPAFDVTPPGLCSGVVTDKGVFLPDKLELYYA